MTRFRIFLLLGIFCFLLAFGVGAFFWLRTHSKTVIFSPLSDSKTSVLQVVDARPLDRYTYENLQKRKFEGSGIEIGKVIKEDPKYLVRMFYFESDGKRISGAMNAPKNLFSEGDSGECSSCTPRMTDLKDSKIIVMLHGSVEDQSYYSGFGTDHVAAELAKKGYVTLAPDFAGLGESDKKAEDPFEARFQTYTTVLNLIASVEKYGGPSTQSASLRANSSLKLGIWGHSNGGQIALSVLEISGKPIPTVLWNPVSRFFPYSILYYTDSFEDRGKNLRHELAKFEEKYDVEKYSLTNYLELINAPILLQQGGNDEWVPRKWSDELAQKIKGNLGGQGDQGMIEYKVYAGSDHNLQPRWSEAVGDVIGFYEEKL